MSVDSTLTYDRTPSTRPALADLQTGTKVDDDIFPPDDTEMPTSDELNQQAKQIAACGRVMPVAVLSVAFAAGVPSVSAHSTAKSAEPTFTVQDMGAGDTKITVPANTFPAAIVSAFACVAEDVDVTISCAPIANGWEVKTRNRATGAGLDCAFTLVVF